MSDDRVVCSSSDPSSSESSSEIVIVGVVDGIEAIGLRSPFWAELVFARFLNIPPPPLDPLPNADVDIVSAEVSWLDDGVTSSSITIRSPKKSFAQINRILIFGRN